MGRSGTGPNPVPQLMEDAASLCRPEYDRHGVKLGVQFDRDLPNVLCDSLQVQQVIVNLLRNSLESIIEAGRRDGKVTIEAERQGDKQVVLRVRDNGLDSIALCSESRSLPSRRPSLRGWDWAFR